MVRLSPVQSRTKIGLFALKRCILLFANLISKSNEFIKIYDILHERIILLRRKTTGWYFLEKIYDNYHQPYSVSAQVITSMCAS